MIQTTHTIVRLLRWAGTLALAAAASAALAAEPAAPAAANAIEALDVLGTQEGKVVVKVTLKQAPAAAPAGFTIANPPRIAFDFPDTANALGRSVHEAAQGDLRNVNIVQAGSRTRLVINLSRSLSYDTEVKGNNVLITLHAAAAAAAAAPAVSHFAEAKPGDKPHAVRDLDFRRGPDGEGRVLVELSDTSTGIDIRRQGKTVVVEFVNATLPKALERRLDVADFATPIQTIDILAQGGNVRMVVEPKGNWEHSAYQADNRFILEVKPIVEDPTRIGGVAGRYTGDKMSLNFQNVDVRAVLQVIADFTGFNILTSDSVTGNLTIRLKDVPWDQALDIILDSKGLDQRKRGNVVWIAPKDELATKEKLELEARQQIFDLEPLRGETFTLNYQKAEEVKKILSDKEQKMLSKRGSVVVDARTNTLIVKDNSSVLEEVRALLKRIDIPQRQVMIEARIVEAADSFTRNIGVKLGYHDQVAQGFKLGSGSGAHRGLVGGGLNDTGFHSGQIATAPAFNESLSVNLPVLAANFPGAPAAGAFSLLLFNAAATKFLNLELTALEADGVGKIISSPRVVTADQVEARIEQGTEIPYLQASASGATSITFKKAVLSLKVKPQITPEGQVLMSLNVNKDRPDFANNTFAGPPINTKQVETQVLVENGGTVVIGGIYEQDIQSTENKIPVLGDLPVVGWMFKNTLKKDNKTELLIFITPRVLSDTLVRR